MMETVDKKEVDDQYESKSLSVGRGVGDREVADRLGLSLLLGLLLDVLLLAAAGDKQLLLQR